MYNSKPNFWDGANLCPKADSMKNYAETGCLQELLDRPLAASKTRFLQ
ncbi:hypothetical protein [Tychonema sp. LEGE 06208]|nr:hypothetical protein [Tychonema sp. LEGE 06208]MBE9162182.1 hypothetical protein [Tychonema sp. LEGE 06208]